MPFLEGRVLQNSPKKLRELFPHSFSHLSWLEIPPILGVWDITYFPGGLSDWQIKASTYVWLLQNLYFIVLKIGNNVHGLLYIIAPELGSFPGPVVLASGLLWLQLLRSCGISILITQLLPSSSCISQSCSLHGTDSLTATSLPSIHYIFSPQATNAIGVSKRE